MTEFFKLWTLPYSP